MIQDNLAGLMEYEIQDEKKKFEWKQLYLIISVLDK